MSKKKVRKTQPTHRNALVLPARMRHAGPMKDDRIKRTNEGEDWSEEIEEYEEDKQEMLEGDSLNEEDIQVIDPDLKE